MISTRCDAIFWRQVSATVMGNNSKSTSTKILESILSRADTDRGRVREIGRAFTTSMQAGGLPGVCFIRDAGLRRLKWESQLETILTRDLELVSDTNLDYRTRKAVFSELAKTQGGPLDYAALSRKVRVSVPALKKLLIAFEALFLIRFLGCEGNERRPTFFLEDQGEAQHVADFKLDEMSVFTNTLYMNIRVPFSTPLGPVESPARHFQYRTRGGAFVPFAFEVGKKALGILPSLEERPSRSILGSAKSFLDAYPNGKAVIIHPHSKNVILSDRLVLLSATTSLV